MMYGDGRFLSIGQMARYSGISEKTLRYYDQIGLLQPARRSEGAGYRYYDRIQLEQALLLQSLKALGMSLAEIKSEFENMSSRRYADLLAVRAEKLEQQIAALEREKQNLSQWQAEVQEAVSAQKGRCYIRRYEGMQGYFYPAVIRTRDEMELSLRRVEQIYGGGTHVGRVVRVVSEESIEKGGYQTYCGLFVPEFSAAVQAGERVSIPAGEYAVIFAAVPHEGCLSYWQQLAGFAKSAGFSAAGCAYRSIPVEMGISRREDDYVSKLFFPIKRI